MAYDQKVVSEIGRQGRGKGRKLIIAAYMTGLVESGLRNLNYGDRDSRGWRQERAMYYKNPNNVRASVARFYQEAEAYLRANPNATPGQIAQGAQQSAFPGRYAQQRGEALRLYKRYGGGGGGVAPGGGAISTRLSNRMSIDWDGLLVDALLGGKSPVQAVLHGADAYAQETPGRKLMIGNAERDAISGKTGLSGITIQKDGWKGSKSVVYGAARGMPSSSEKRGTQSTATGGTSDHWVGSRESYARDIPARGADGERKAHKLARRLGIKNFRTGNFNSYEVTIQGRRYRVQILWNVADHYDHVHLGVKRIG